MDEKLELNDFLYTERLGNPTSPPLFILHGWGNSIETMKPLGQLLSRFYDVHLIDLPGFGKSPPPNNVWDSFDYARIILDYAKSHSLDSIHLLGHSYGGKVAMSFAYLYPKNTQKLVLIAASGLMRKRSWKQSLRYYSLKGGAKALKNIDTLGKTNLFHSYFVPKFGSVDYQRAGIMRPILVKSVNEDLSDTISEICHPTLILWGEKDQETPLEMGKRLHNLIKNSTFYSFENKGHHPFEEAGAHLLATYIIPFLGANFS